METSIMKIVTPNKLVAGYIVAAGIPAQDKGI
jgi:hypothetical protein